MKGTPIKRNRKKVIFSRSQGVWSSPYMSLSFPFTWPPFCPSTLPPTLLPSPSVKLCCVICGSCGSLFYMRWLLCPAFTLLWPVREQLTNSTVYFRCCWLSHAVSPFAGLFPFNISLLLSRCFSLGLLLQFNCVRAAVISRSPRTEQFMVNTLQKARYLANPMFCSC